MWYFCECAQNQPVKQILPKTSPDNSDIQVFQRVDEATKNESLNALSLIGNAKSFGDGNVFPAKNTKNTIKTDVPPDVNDLEVVETSKSDFAFGHNYTNVFADLLKKFNKYCSFKFI